LCDMGRAPCASQSPQDFMSCGAGARPGHPISGREQPQQTAADHLVGVAEQRNWEREAQRLRGLDIDDSVGAR
jgi:hypothetical protein